MRYVRVKTGAGFPTLAPAGVRILAALDAAASSLGVVLLVTSGSEERGRSLSDPHMTGEAADVRVSHLADGQVRALVADLRSLLGPAFTVLYEVPTAYHGPLADIAYRSAGATAPHLHIQRAKGTSWPDVKQA